MLRRRGASSPKKDAAFHCQPQPTTSTSSRNERNKTMAMKTTNIEVKVDEQLAAAIADKAVKQWHATSFSNGKRRVYVTFEEVRTVSA